MSIPPTGRVVGVDWGEVRIGLAIADETQLLASPLGTLVRRPGKRFPAQRFEALIAGRSLAGIVVGLPLTSEGTEGPAAAAARQLAHDLGRRTGLPVELWDERLSTARALGVVRELGGSTRGRKADVDALAAAVMLQGWLERRASARSRSSTGPVGA